MAKIVTTNIIADSREKGRAGLVIAEHIFDDGRVWPAVFEAMADEDAATRLDAMVQEREAQRSVADDASAKAQEVEAATIKRDEYIKALPDKTLADAGFTAKEVEIIKGDAAAIAADVQAVEL